MPAHRKVARPDGYLADIYQSLPALPPVATGLFNAIIISDRILQPRLELNTVPLDEPKEDQTKCTSTCPITLIHTPSKAAEPAVLNSLPPVVDPL